MRTLAPAATPDELATFAQKCIEFIALHLRETFPGVPIYLALGNNDSGCADKHQSVGSTFLQVTSQVLIDGTLNQSHRAAVRPLVGRLGDYSAVLPRAIRRGRLLVVEDIFAMPEYRNCEGKADNTLATEQMAWLREQLTSARAHHEQVWIMAHVPPGVDQYASFHKYLATPQKLCNPVPLTMMLTSNDLTATLTEFSDIFRLAIFGHTHMDEIKLLSDGKGHNVPARLVPSISPVNGNLPAFIAGKVDPDSGILKDYTVYVASDASATSWQQTYSYSSTYGEPDYSAKSVRRPDAAACRRSSWK